MRPFRIVLADDHVLFRQGIRNILERRPELAVVAEAGDGLELLEMMKKIGADLVIMDISMPHLRGLEALREIRKSHPDLRVLFLTMHKELEYMRAAIQAGAEGYLLKEDADTDLFKAIESIRKGGRYLSPLLSSSAAYELLRGRVTGKTKSAPDDLTLREREVLTLIAEGTSSREIATRLFISPRTVEHHRENMMRKLNVRSTAQLVKYAITRGYVPATD